MAARVKIESVNSANFDKHFAIQVVVLHFTRTGTSAVPVPYL